MRSLHPLVLLAALCCGGSCAPTACGRVIDDFTVGTASYVGPATVNQADLDPAHVIGGSRSIGIDRAGSTLAVDAAGGFRFQSSDWGYFNLTYGGVTPLGGVDLTQDGHDRLFIQLGEIGADFRPFNLYVNLPPSSSNNGRGLYIRDAWDGILLEALYAKFPVSFTAVDKITINTFRNPAGTAFELNGVTTGRRGATGDFNYDGVIDANDLGELRKAFGVTTFDGATLAFVASADADQNGFVNGADFLSWQLAHGTQPPSNAVPEPTSALLLLLFLSIAGAWLVRNGRRTPAMSCS